MPGIEPGTFHMQSERSTAELQPLVILWAYDDINNNKLTENYHK